MYKKQNVSRASKKVPGLFHNRRKRLPKTEMKSLPSVHKNGCGTEVGERITFSTRGEKYSKNSRSQVERTKKLQLCIVQPVPHTES